MRLFIAVPVDPVRRRLGGIIDELRATNANCTWVRPENLHLTMQFLGETPPPLVEAVGRAMEGAVQGRGRFELSFGGLGAFPSLERPRVVWVGLAGGAQGLRDLAEALARELAEQEVPVPEEGRGFRAHLTIGRIRGPRDLGRLRASMASWPPERLALGTVPVDGLTLYKSELKPGGPVYTAVRTAVFASPH